MKAMRTYKVGKRTAKNYNEWMKYLYKEVGKKNKIYFKKFKLNEKV